MKSIRELYKAGRGPSSSHTMGPDKACRMFAKEYPGADAFTVVLYGSLAKTGKGHGTDVAVIEALAPAKVTVEWQPEPDFELPHPNTMDLIAYADGGEVFAWTIDDVVEYETPMALAALGVKRAPQSWMYVEVDELWP